MVLVLIGQIPLLQGVPDDEPGDLIGQHRVVPGGHVPQAGVAVQGPAPDGHDVGAVLGGGGQAQVQPAQQLAQGAELVALLGHDEDHPPPLLPQPPAQALQGERLAHAGGPADPAVAVGIFVVIVGVQKHRGAVVEVQPQEDAVAVAELVGGKGKSRRHAGGKGIAPGFALHVRVQGQQRQGREKRLLVFVVAAAGDHVNGYAQLFHRRHPLF